MFSKILIFALILLIPVMASATERMPHPDPEPPPPAEPSVDVDVGVDVGVDVDTDVIAEGDGPVTNTNNVGGDSMVIKHRRGAASAQAPATGSNKKCTVSAGVAVQFELLGISLGGDKPANPKKDDSCLYELYDRLIELGRYEAACKVVFKTRAADYSEIDEKSTDGKHPCDGATGPPAATPQTLVLVVNGGEDVDEKIKRAIEAATATSDEKLNRLLNAIIMSTSPK